MSFDFGQDWLKIIILLTLNDGAYNVKSRYRGGIPCNDPSKIDWKKNSVNSFVRYYTHDWSTV